MSCVGYLFNYDAIGPSGSFHRGNFGRTMHRHHSMPGFGSCSGAAPWGLPAEPRSRREIGAVCDPGVGDDWIEVAWSPPAEAGTARADLGTALDTFLSQRSLGRADLAKDDRRSLPEGL